MTNMEYISDFEHTIDMPYLARKGEGWHIYCGYFGNTDCNTWIAFSIYIHMEPDRVFSFRIFVCKLQIFLLLKCQEISHDFISPRYLKLE